MNQAIARTLQPVLARRRMRHPDTDSTCSHCTVGGFKKKGPGYFDVQHHYALLLKVLRSKKPGLALLCMCNGNNVIMRVSQKKDKLPSLPLLQILNCWQFAICVLPAGPTKSERSILRFIETRQKRRCFHVFSCEGAAQHLHLCCVCPSVCPS